jgi:3-deoxy-D-manno-octulosonic-acid transferase
MCKFWLYVYNILSVPLIWFLFRVYSLFNSKVRDGFAGRRHIFPDLENNKKILQNGNRNIIIHCSSLGEYQQAVPIYRELLNRNFNIIITFFSPSGYRNAKISGEKIIKTYLPFDSFKKIKKFLGIISPEIIIMMRYDLWFNFLYRAKKMKIMTAIANARFDVHDKTWIIPAVSSFKKCMFGMIDVLFAIDDEDEMNFKKVLSCKSEIFKVGDSKFERVLQTVKTINPDGVIDGKIVKDKKVFVIGSSWKEDEEIILPVIDKVQEHEARLLTILVPHEPKETKLLLIEKNILQSYGNLKSIRYSRLENYSGENLIIVDCIGKLLNLYSISYVSYVGGGLRSGLHNILEPAIFNVPVFFSNAVKNSDEDEVMLESGGGILVENKNQFYKDIRRILEDRKLRDEIGEKCKMVFKDKIGIAEKIVNHLFEIKNSKQGVRND